MWQRNVVEETGRLNRRDYMWMLDIHLASQERDETCIETPVL